MWQTAVTSVRLLLLVSQLMADCLGQHSNGYGAIASGLAWTGEIGPSSSPMGLGGGYHPGYDSGYGQGLSYAGYGHGFGYDGSGRGFSYGRYGHGLGYSGSGYGVGYNGYGGEIGCGGTYQPTCGYGLGYGQGQDYDTRYGQSLSYPGGLNPVQSYDRNAGPASATGFASAHGSMGPGFGYNSGTGFPNDGRYGASYPYAPIYPTVIASTAMPLAQPQIQSTSNKNTNTNTNTNINIDNRVGKRRRGSLTRELLGM